MSSENKSVIMSKEDFKQLYKSTNGFMPEQSKNHPLFSTSNMLDYYTLLEEGCDLLIKNNPELVHLSEQEIE